jgi:hypothetical protein
MGALQRGSKIELGAAAVPVEPGAPAVFIGPGHEVRERSLGPRESVATGTGIPILGCFIGQGDGLDPGAELEGKFGLMTKVVSEEASLLGGEPGGKVGQIRRAVDVLVGCMSRMEKASLVAPACPPTEGGASERESLRELPQHGASPVHRRVASFKVGAVGVGEVSELARLDALQDKLSKVGDIADHEGGGPVRGGELQTIVGFRGDGTCARWGPEPIKAW